MILSLTYYNIVLSQLQWHLKDNVTPISKVMEKKIIRFTMNTIFRNVTLCSPMESTSSPQGSHNTGRRLHI
jgi:hypothetical protein